MGFTYKAAKNTVYVLCVPEPWHINEFTVSGCSSVQHRQCLGLTLDDQYFSIWTSDPNAPAINVTAEIYTNSQ